MGDAQNVQKGDVAFAPFFKPPDNSPEMEYLRERRAALGGYVPRRCVVSVPLKPPAGALFAEFYEGTSGRAVSTTMAFFWSGCICRR